MTLSHPSEDLLADFRWIKTPEDAVRSLNAIRPVDVAVAHVEADQTLIAYLDATFPEISAAWRQLQERCDGFRYEIRSAS